LLLLKKPATVANFFPVFFRLLLSNSKNNNKNNNITKNIINTKTKSNNGSGYENLRWDFLGILEGSYQQAKLLITFY
jgi:hypothetical protein